MSITDIKKSIKLMEGWNDHLNAPGTDDPDVKAAEAFGATEEIEEAMPLGIDKNRAAKHYNAKPGTYNYTPNNDDENLDGELAKQARMDKLRKHLSKKESIELDEYDADDVENIVYSRAGRPGQNKVMSIIQNIIDDRKNDNRLAYNKSVIHKNLSKAGFDSADISEIESIFAKAQEIAYRKIIGGHPKRNSENFGGQLMPGFNDKLNDLTLKLFKQELSKMNLEPSKVSHPKYGRTHTSETIELDEYREKDFDRSDDMYTDRTKSFEPNPAVEALKQALDEYGFTENLNDIIRMIAGNYSMNEHELRAAFEEKMLQSPEDVLNYRMAAESTKTETQMNDLNRLIELAGGQVEETDKTTQGIIAANKAKSDFYKERENDIEDLSQEAYMEYSPGDSVVIDGIPCVLEKDDEGWWAVSNNAEHEFEFKPGMEDAHHPVAESNETENMRNLIDAVSLGTTNEEIDPKDRNWDTGEKTTDMFPAGGADSNNIKLGDTQDMLTWARENFNGGGFKRSNLKYQHNVVSNIDDSGISVFGGANGRGAGGYIPMMGRNSENDQYQARKSRDGKWIISKIYNESIEENNELNEKEQLDEDLGNLEQINPALHSAFGGYGKKRIGKKIGPASEILDIEYKNASQAYRDLISGNAAGLIALVGDREVVALFGRPNRSRHGHDGFNYAIDREWLDENLPGRLSNELNSYKISSTQGNNWASETDITNILRNLQADAKAAGFKISAKIVNIDKERAKKQSARAANKPIDFQSREFKQQARRALNDRLDKFKAANADSIDSVEDLVPFVTEKGYVDKLKVGDHIYSYYDDNINMRGLKGDKFYRDSVIEYQIDVSSPEYKALRRQLWDEEDETKRDELRRTIMPPTRLKITLELKGGTIVPTKVEAEDRGF